MSDRIAVVTNMGENYLQSLQTFNAI